MAEFVMRLLGLLVRISLALAGLVFFVSLLAAALLLLMLWLARALWASLTGKTVSPWTFRVNRQATWDRFYRQSGTRNPPSAADVVDAEVRDISVVTDVTAKRLTPPTS